MKYGLLKLESLLPWKLILLTSPQGQFGDILIVFSVCVCVLPCVALDIKCHKIRRRDRLRKHTSWMKEEQEPDVTFIRPHVQSVILNEGMSMSPNFTAWTPVFVCMS